MQLTSRTVETIAYNLTVLSLMRMNFIPFLISTRNPLVTIVHLFRTARVQHVLVSADSHSQQLLDQVLEILHSENSCEQNVPKVAPMVLFEDFFSHSQSAGHCI